MGRTESYTRAAKALSETQAKDLLNRAQILISQMCGQADTRLAEIHQEQTVSLEGTGIHTGAHLHSIQLDKNFIGRPPYALTRPFYAQHYSGPFDDEPQDIRKNIAAVLDVRVMLHQHPASGEYPGNYGEKHAKNMEEGQCKTLKYHFFVPKDGKDAGRIHAIIESFDFMDEEMTNIHDLEQIEERRSNTIQTLIPIKLFDLEDPTSNIITIRLLTHLSEHLPHDIAKKVIHETLEITPDELARMEHMIAHAKGASKDTIDFTPTGYR